MSDNLHSVDLTHDEIRALIISSQAMLEGMQDEGSQRPKELVDAHNKLVKTNNFLVDVEGL